MADILDGKGGEKDLYLRMPIIQKKVQIAEHIKAHINWARKYNVQVSEEDKKLFEDEFSKSKSKRSPSAYRKLNPNLKPEVATGVDVAVERYLPQGGVLSASAFHRRVQNLIRNVTTQESSGRWLSSPQNISEAVTEGIELEAKFRLDQWIDDAPHIDLRNNLSFYRSRVLSIMGPDNRLDQQPSMTANLGADYRLKAVPVTLGGNLNYNPGYTTRLSAEQLTTISQKRVMDVYGLWRVDGNTAWRLTLSNLDPRYYNTGSVYSGNGVVENSNTRNRSWTNVQILLEKKL